MTGRELIGKAEILEVWTGLGGGKPRRNKGCAWWRESTSWSVSLSPEKQAFYDFSPHEGGGVLALIRRVLGCDKRAALAWLASFYNVDLDNRPQSITERRAWQRTREEAEKKAAELVWWREDLLLDLRQRRNAIWDAILAVERFGREFVNQPGRDDLWRFAFECFEEEKEGERLEGWIIRIEDMLPAELIALRERMAAREALAA